MEGSRKLGGHTDGNNSGPGIDTVAATLSVGKQLTNSDHYYLMATVDAGQGDNGIGNNFLEFGDSGAGIFWEPLLPGYQTSPDTFSGMLYQGAFEVFVGQSVSTPGTPGSGGLAILISAGLAVSCAFKRRRSRSSAVRPLM